MQLISSLGSPRAPSLYDLDLTDTGVGDRTIETLAAALRDGLLGRRLRYLRLPMGAETSWNTLANALTQGGGHLELLEMLTVGDGDDGSLANISTIRMALEACGSCPALQRIMLTKRFDEHEDALRSVTCKNARGNIIHLSFDRNIRKP